MWNRCKSKLKTAFKFNNTVGICGTTTNKSANGKSADLEIRSAEIWGGMGKGRTVLYSAVEMVSCRATCWRNHAGEVILTTVPRMYADLAASKLVLLLRWCFLPELLHIWRKAKNLEPAPNTDTEIWRYATTVLALLLLVLSLFFPSLLEGRVERFYFLW